MIEHLQYIHRQLAQRNIAIGMERLLNVKVRTVVQRISPQQTKIYCERWLPAYGHYYFLINAAQLPVGTKITSDTHTVWVEAGIPTESVEELSGLIHIQIPPEQVPAHTLIQCLFYEIIPK